MRALPLLLVLLGCDVVPPAIDAGPDAAPLDADADASVARDAGPAWRRLCGVALERPTVGEDAYCPAVHDYVARALVSDGGVPDAQICGDGGCAPAERAWGVLEGCAGWVDCDIGRESRCFHCIDWGDDPR